MRKHLLLSALALILPLVLPAQQIVKGRIENAPQHKTYMPTFKSDGASKYPKNIILMIGDGTGLAHIASGYYANGGQLTVTNLKACGWVTTQSADAFTTDSAASGTAYACGQKTYNNAVGVDMDRKPIPNIPEIVAERRIISGVVSTDDMHGATPASFFAHQPQRRMYTEIWGDLPGSVLSFWSAGSQEAFAKQATPETQQAVRETFTVVTSLDDPAVWQADRLGYLPTAVESGYIVDGRTDFLPKTTAFAVKYLKQHSNRRRGFFLMVEGARIDKASHGNQYESMVREMLDFDQAIEQAIRFADEDGNTLVIICADHETGGTTLWNGDPAKGNMEGVFVSTHHTPIPIPLFAYGPRSQDFMGVQGNEEVGQKIIKLLMQR